MNDIPPDTRYRGRFAPSPTGPLHFGSLVTALGSWLQARSRNGEWVLRMEDLDSPREIPGAADDILRTLEACGLYWDGPVLYQSQRHAAYDEALAQLAAGGHSYPCSCSRKRIAKTTAGKHPGLYPGTCRNGLPPGTTARAIRVRCPSHSIHFRDSLRGRIKIHLAHEVGDFVVRRADGLCAYHLAVVVDDAHQGITEIVRGADLLIATPPQRHLQTLLGLLHPQPVHLPIAVNAAGQKLSKQTHAPAINRHQPTAILSQALVFLGHPPSVELTGASPNTLLEWALDKWALHRVQSRILG
jgi:glutamyl-Q tRNA(Asp) synthetase